MRRELWFEKGVVGRVCEMRRDEEFLEGSY